MERCMELVRAAYRDYEECFKELMQEYTSTGYLIDTSLIIRFHGHHRYLASEMRGFGTLLDQETEWLVEARQGLMNSNSDRHGTAVARATDQPLPGLPEVPPQQDALAPQATVEHENARHREDEDAVGSWRLTQEWVDAALAWADFQDLGGSYESANDAFIHHLTIAIRSGIDLEDSSLEEALLDRNYERGQLFFIYATFLYVLAQQLR